MTRARRAARPLAAALVSLLLALTVVELLLHARPSLLPGWYRESFPLHGVELFFPGTLERTPVDRVPLPFVAGGHDGPPPTDLVEMGLVPPDVDLDRRRYPRVVVPADELGLPNPERPERADLVLVGDSFLVAAGATRPVGLAGALAERSGRSVYVCAVAGIGPTREAALLEDAGLALRPDGVVWFFFGGNDVIDALEPLVHARRGHQTYGELFADRAPPRLLLPDLVRVALADGGPAPESDPLPALDFPGSELPVWLHPGHLEQCLWTRADWEGSPGWTAVTDALGRARDACEANGTRFALVYLPTKTQVTLPHLADDPEALARMASFQRAEPHAGDPDELARRMLAGRGNLEELMRSFCEAQGIPFLSATPALEALAARGESGYLVADTHWQDVGQDALLEPLLAWLEELGWLDP